MCYDLSQLKNIVLLLDTSLCTIESNYTTKPEMSLLTIGEEIHAKKELRYIIVSPTDTRFAIFISINALRYRLEANCCDETMLLKI